MVETQDVSFEQPVHSVEFYDGSSVPHRNRLLLEAGREALKTRYILGSLLFIAVITIFYFANENTELRSEIDRIEHSREYIYQTLESEGISWDKSSRKFTQDVTEPSPDRGMLDK